MEMGRVGFETSRFTFVRKRLYVDGDNGQDAGGLEYGQAFVWNNVVETRWRTL